MCNTKENKTDHPKIWFVVQSVISRSYLVQWAGSNAEYSLFLARELIAILCTKLLKLMQLNNAMATKMRNVFNIVSLWIVAARYGKRNRSWNQFGSASKRASGRARLCQQLPHNCWWRVPLTWFSFCQLSAPSFCCFCNIYIDGRVGSVRCSYSGFWNVWILLLREVRVRESRSEKTTENSVPIPWMYSCRLLPTQWPFWTFEISRKLTSFSFSTKSLLYALKKETNLCMQMKQLKEKTNKQYRDAKR